MSREYIESQVRSLTDRFGTRNPFELADGLGFHVYYSNFNVLKGCLTSICGTHAICLNQRLPKNEQELVCAHELGHAILHGDMVHLIQYMNERDLFCTSKNEREANQFAAFLLIRDDLLSQYDGYSIGRIARCEGLYPELIKLRFNL